MGGIMDITRLFKAGFKLTALSSFFFWHFAFALPDGGNVAAGSANISQSNSQTVINQTSQNTVINWSSFNTNSSEAVLFNQPNSSAIALNRINSGTPTNFAGSLSANGQVWILNPAGVVFTSTSKIDVAGLLVTTHNITDSNFMSGNYLFNLMPGSENSKIINNGLITAKDSGIVAFVAPGVENNGIITANLGKVYLSSGSTYVVDLYGDNLINFGSSPAVQNGYVSNSGKIIASGGKVVMTANSAGKIVNDVISMSGIIEATTTSTGRHGEIILNGGNSGVTRVSGKLRASGGGHIETSGHVLIIESTTEIDAGMGGSWLIDPFNITVVAGSGFTNNGGPTAFVPSGTSTIGATLISNQLSGGTAVTLDTGAPGGDAGNITISAPITQTATAVALTLTAANDITINSAITMFAGAITATATAGNLTVAAPISQTSGGAITFTAGNTVNINSTISNGAAITVTSGSGPINIAANVNRGGAQTWSSAVVLTGNAILTSTGAITFASTVNGPFNLTITEPGSFILNSNFNNLGNLNAFTITNAADIQATGNTTKTTTTQTYNGPVTLDNLAAITFQGTTISFNNTVEQITTSPAITITGALSIGAAGEIGQGSPISILSVSGATTTASLSAIPYIVTTGNQTYTGVVNGAVANTDNFNINSGGMVALHGVGSTTALNKVTISATSGIQLFGDVLTSGNQVFNNAVVIESAGTLFAPNLTLRTTGGTLTFNSTLDDVSAFGHDIYLISTAFPTFTGTPGAITPFLQFALSEPSFNVDATLAAFAVTQLNMGSSFYLGAYTTTTTVSSPITQTINLQPVTLTLNATTSDNINAPITLLAGGSFGASAAPINLAANISTGGSQSYNTAVVLTGGPVTLTSTASSIGFGSTISGAFDLTINAATSTTIRNTNIGSLAVTAPGGVSLQGTSYTTANNMTFNSTIIPLAFATLTYTTTGGGDISFAAFSQTVNNNMTVLSSGKLTFNGVADFTNSSSTLFFSALGGIFINTSFIGSQFGMTFAANSPITLLTNTFLHSTLTNTSYGSSINGAFSLTIDNDTAGNGPTLTFSQPIGNINALTSLSIYEPAGPMNINASIDVNGAISLVSSSNFSGGTITLAAPIGATSNVTTLYYHGATGINFNAGASVLTSSNQTYDSGAQGGNNWQGPVILGQNTTLTSTAGSITILRPQIVFLTGLGINSDAVGTPRTLTLNGPAGVNIQVDVGNTAPLSSLTVNGLAIIDNQAVIINTIGDQLYNNGASLGVSTALTSSAGNILFSGTVNGGVALTTSVPNGKSLTFNGAVGNSAALFSLTTSATGTTFINGGQVRTSSGTQNYNNPVFIGVFANTTLGGVGTTGAININSTLDSFDATPRGLILTTTALTTLSGNLGITNILSGLTVTNSAAINVATITTTTLQAYLGVTTLGVANTTLNTNSGGTITFGNTVNGASNLLLNTVSSGIVNFNNAIGATTALTSLSIPNSPTINMNTGTTSIRTVDSQTYSGPVLFNSLAAITFTHTNLTAPRAINFNNTVNSNTTSTALTITGNLAVGPSGSIGLQFASPGNVHVGSISVSGTTLGPNTNTSGNQIYSGALTLNTDESMISTAGSITYGSTVNGDGVLGRNLTINAATAVNFNGIVGGSFALASLTATGPTNINTTGITTTGNQLFNSAVILGASPTLKSTGNGSITFGSTINGDVAATRALTLNPLFPLSSVVFTNSIGNTASLFSLTVTGLTSINPSNVGSFVMNTSGTQTYNNAVILGGTETLSGSVMTFNGTINNSLGSGTFTVNGSLTNGTAIVFNQAIGNLSTAFGTLVVSAIGNIVLGSTLDNLTGSSSVTETAQNSAITFTGAVGSLHPISSLTVNVLNTFITFQSTVDNITTLTLNGSQTAAMNFNGKVGSLGPIPTLNVTSTFVAGGGSGIVTFGDTVDRVTNMNINSAGPAIFNGTVDNINGNAIFSITSGGATFNAPVGSLYSTFGRLNLTSFGNVLVGSTLDGLTGASTINETAQNPTVTFTGAIGSLHPIASLAVTGMIGAITFQGTINNIVGALTVTGNQSAAINFNGQIGNLSSVGSLSATSTFVAGGGSGVITFGNTITNLGTLSATTFSTININTASINTTTSQTYLGSTINLGVATIGLTTNAGGSIIFNAGIVGASNLTVNPTATGSVTFAGTVGSTTALSSLSVTGATNVNTATMRTSGDQTYNGAITQAANTTYTSTSGTNLIKFVNSITGNAVGRTLTVNSGATGNIEFDSTIGTVGTPFASLTLTGNTTYMAGVGPTVFVSGAELYNQNLVLNNIPTLALNGTSVTFSGAVTSVTAPTALTIPGNLIVAATGSVGQGVGAALDALTVTGTTNGSNNVTTIHNQLYNGAYTVSGNSILTSTLGGITFNTSVAADSNGTRDLSLVAATPITLGGAFNLAPLLRSLTIGSVPIPTQANITAAAISTTLAQTYFGPVLFQSLAAENFTAPTVTFNNTVNSVTTPTAITITGGLVVGTSGSIGLTSNVASLHVTGTTLGPNVTTSGNQLYSGALTLNTDETMISTAGNITFSNTVNGGFNLVVNAAGQATFANTVGTIIPLASLDVTGVTAIDMGNGAVTTGNQTYHNTMILEPFVAQNFTTTVNGNLVFQSASGYGNFLTNFILNAKGTISLSGSMGNVTSLDLTAANVNAAPFAIILNASSLLISSSSIFRSPVEVVGGVSVNNGVINFLSTIDGPGSLNALTGSAITVNGDIGDVTPLSSLSLYSNNVGTTVSVAGAIHVTGAVFFEADNNALGNGFIYFTAPTPVTSTVGSLSIVTGTLYLSNQNISSTGSQSYTTAVSPGILPRVVLHTDSVLSSSAGNILFWGPINNCVVGGGGPVCSGALNNLTTSAPSGSVTFQQPVGGTAPFNNLTVNGTAVIATSSITTAGNQLYNNAVALSASPTLTSTAGNITFVGAVNGGGGLTTSVVSGKTVTFSSTVGATTALGFLTTSATGTTDINGGSVRTSGAQNYNDPVVLGADTVLTSTGSTLNFVSINSDGTPRGLTLTAPGTTTLTGNIGTGLGPAGILKFLTITNASTINIAGPTPTMNTTQAFTFGGALTLASDATLNTNAAGTIAFNSTIVGPGNLIANASPTGTVTFANTVGATTALGGLAVTGATNVNTTTMRTSGAQTYNGAITQSANTIYTSTSGANLIKFVSSIIGNAVGRTLTVNSGATGSVEFDAAIGSLAIPFTSLTLTGNTSYMAGVGPTVFVSGAELYGNNLILNNIPTLALNGTSVTFNGAVTSTGTATALTIPGNLIVSSTGSVGQGLGAALDALTVTGTTNGANNVTTIHNQLYNGAYTVSGNSILTSTLGGIIFNTSVAADSNGTRDLTLIAALPVTLGGSFNVAPLLRSLTIGSVPIPTQANITTTAISTTLAQTYFGPVLFQSLAAENFTAPTVTFNNTVNSITTQTALTITGNLAVGPSGSIGLQFASPGNVHVGSIFVSGTTLGPNTNTSGDQTYTLGVTLNTDETMTSTAGKISFGSTINGDGVLGRNLTLNAVSGTGSVTFNGIVGGSVPLSSLIVNAGSITINTTAISTSGVQNYMSSNFLTIQPAALVTLTGSEIDFNQNVFGNPAGSLTINGNLVLNTPNGSIPTNIINTIIVNGSTTINANILTPYITASQNATFNGPITVLGPGFGGVQPAVLSVGTGILTVNGTIDGPGPLELFTGGAGIVNVNGAVGGTTPLSSFQIAGFGGTPSTANINTATIHTVNDQTYTNLAMVLDQNTVWTSNAGGIVLNSGTTVNALTVGGESLQLIAAPGVGVTLTGNIGNINKLSSLTIGSNLVATPAGIQTSAISTTVSQTYYGSVDVDNISALNLTTGLVTFNDTVISTTISTALTINGNLVLNTPKGGMPSSTFNTIIVNGSTTINSGITTPYITASQNATFNGSVTVLGPGLVGGQPAVLGVGTGILTVNGTIDGPGPLELITGGVGIVNVNGAVGGTTPLSSFQILGFGGTPTTANINTATIHTVNNQTYTNLAMVLDQNTVWTSNAGGINFNSAASTINALTNGGESLQLISPNTVSLIGNIGNINKLSSLTIGSNLVATPASISTPSIATTISQTYFGPVLFQSLGAINFTHTNLTFPNAITFNNTVNSVATSTAMTITGNLAVGPSGSIGLQFASPGNVHVGSILVTGTTLGPNTNTSGDQTYAGALTLNTDETMTSTAGRITFGSTVDGDGVLGRNLNVNANSGAFGAVRFNGVVGGLIPLASLASTVPTGGFSTAFNTTSVTTTGTQTYSGIVVVNNTNNPTNFNFSGSTVSFNDVLATGVFSPTNLVNITITGNFVLTGPNGNIQTQLGGLQVNSLHVTGASTFSNPNLFTGVNVLSYQTYDGPVSLNVDNVIFAIQNPGSVITFGSTLQSNGGPWGVQIVLGTPTSVVNFNGIVGGVGGSNPLSSLDFTNFGDPSATININTSQINTTGLQNYRGIVRLGTDTTLTSTTSGMTFSSTVDSNTAVVANARALTLVSPLTVTLSGNIGSINKLKSLTIGSGLVATPANISTPSITTTTSQTYFGPVTLNSPTVTLTSGITPTITGIITFNNSINAASSGVQSLVVNANNGPATGNVFFNNSVGAVTPLNSITVNSGTVTMNNNSIANFLVHTTGVGADPIGSQVYSGTLTSPGTVTLTSDSENISFFNANGAAFKLIANAPNGAVILTSGGTISINTLDITGLTYLPQGGFIDTTGASVYNGSILLNTLIPGDQVWFGGLTTVTVHGSVYTQLGATATVTLNQSSPTFIIDGNMGDITTLVVKGVNIQTEHMNALVVFGSLVFNGNFIRSVGIQRYMQPVTFTAPTVNLINDSNGAIYGVGINFFNTPVSGLNTDLITQGDTYFGRLVASGITPITVTLKSFTNTAFLTDIVGGSSITTTNAQTYGGQVILDNIGNNNAVTLAGSTMTFNGAVLQNPNVTPVGLIITGNMVANAVIGPSNISGGFFAGQNGTLRSLTVNGQSNLNGGLVNTTNNQLYNGPVLLGATNLLNSNLGNITFNSTIDNNFNLTVDAIQTRFKGVVGTTPIGALTVNSNIINFSNAVTSVTSSGIQTYTGTGVNPLMTIGLDPVFTAPSFVIAIAVLINADTTYNSTAGNIDFQQIVTGDGVSFLHLNPVGGSAMFESTVGTGGAPLGSLVINGTSLFDQGSAQVVNTTNNQTYFGGAAVNLVTLNNNITMTSQSGIVSFSLGAIDVAGITGPAFNLSIFTFNPANGPTGAGIAGTVHVANFTMGGTGGGNVSPLLADYSTVGGSSGVGAWNNTVIDPAATGLYCVNGNCISGSRVLNIDANNEIKTYGQIITPNSVADVAKITTTGLAPGDSVTNITLTSLGYPQTATVLGGPYVINASGASGPGLANHYTSIVYGNTPGFVTVNTAPLTVTGNNIIKTYGQTITFTGTEFNTTGTFYNGDNITSVTLNSPGAVSTANVAGSTYPVTPSAAVGTGLSNYSITYSPSGTIAVNPAAVTITSSSQSKNYGTTLSPTTSAFTTDIVLPNSETIGTVDIVSAGLSPAATVLGGPYAITGVSNAAGGTFDPNNYAITYAPAGSITVNPLAVNITSSSQSKNYGTTLSPTTNAFTTNIVLPNSETIGTVDIVSAGLSPTASVLGGPYAITGVSNAAGGTFDPTNYAITYTPAGSITVNPLAVTITSTSQSKNYGTTLSPTTNAFTTNIVLPNSETIGTVDIASAGLSPTASVLGGPYAITGVSNAAGGTFDVNNYNISYTPAGSITVNPLAVTITSSPQTKTFGVTLPPATTFFTTDIVLPNSETIGTVDIASAGLPGSAPVGSYSIDTASNATGGTFDINNYTINYVAANNITVTGGPTPTPTPTPMNIPPTQVFPYPIDPTACGASGCGNVEIIKQPNNCAYSNIGIEDYISNPMARKALLKQEEECACQTDNKWMKYCRANIKHVVYTDNHKLHAAPITTVKNTVVKDRAAQKHELKKDDAKLHAPDVFTYTKEKWSDLFKTKKDLYFR
jgi:filamentous hemagglutinin family protein